MKIILTEEDVKRLAVLYLKHTGQLNKDAYYEAVLQTYDEDFLIIKATGLKQDGK